MKKWEKKLIAILLTVVISAAMIAGCGRSNLNTSDSSEVGNKAEENREKMRISCC